MKLNRYPAPAGAAAGAAALAVLTVAACAAAPAKASSHGAAGTPVATMSRAVPGGTTNIMIFSVNSDGAYFRAIVTGAIGDDGPAVTIYPSGKIDPAHDHQMLLKLSHGTFRLAIRALDKAFVTAASHEPIYPKTCTDLISVTSATPIVAGSGTGAYQGISGSFPVTITLNEVEQKPCQPSPGAFVSQLITVAGSGTVSFSR